LRGTRPRSNVMVKLPPPSFKHKRTKKMQKSLRDWREGREGRKKTLGGEFGCKATNLRASPSKPKKRDWRPKKDPVFKKKASERKGARRGPGQGKKGPRRSPPKNRKKILGEKMWTKTAAKDPKNLTERGAWGVRLGTGTKKKLPSQ